MGIPESSALHKYYFPAYNNTWAPLNSQIRFAHLDAEQKTIRVTIGGGTSGAGVPGQESAYLQRSGGPVVIESLDPAKKIVAAIRLQSLATNTLSSYSETMGIPDQVLSTSTTSPPTTTPGLPSTHKSASATWMPRRPDQGDHRRGERLGGRCAGLEERRMNFDCQRRTGQRREPGPDQKDRGCHPPAVLHQ